MSHDGQKLVCRYFFLLFYIYTTDKTIARAVNRVGGYGGDGGYGHNALFALLSGQDDPRQPLFKCTINNDL